MKEISKIRAKLTSSRRVVVKVGTGLLVDSNCHLRRNVMQKIVSQLASLLNSGIEVVLVSSGAVGAGVEALGLLKRPSSLAKLQMAASVGQSRLVASYQEMFESAGITVGQVLLTHDALNNRKRHLSMRQTIIGLLKRKILPIVNENDVIAVDELKFGDNDMLAALFSILIGADCLLLLTTEEGVLDPKSSKRIPFIERVSDDTFSLVQKSNSLLSTGGMASKLIAAQIVVEAGLCAIIADGSKDSVIQSILSGEDTGTLLGIPSETPQSGPQGKKHWIAYFHHEKGSLVIDEGAYNAIKTEGHSLLSPGISTLEGSFEAGDLVSVKTATGAIVARGLVGYSSEEIAAIKGKSREKVKVILGVSTYKEVIHRDNMLVL